MPLVSYEQVRPWARAIREAAIRRTMPPWFADRGTHSLRFSNDPSLTVTQIQQIADWVDAGARAGDRHDAPAPEQWAEGWGIDPPDVVIQMPKPVPVPAQGDVDYTYVIVPTDFEQDRWVNMSEIRPTDRASFTMRLSTYGSLIRTGSGARRWVRPSPSQRCRGSRTAGTRCGLTVICC